MSDWPGYWRLFKQGPIEFAHYNTDTRKIRNTYEVPFIYGPSETHNVDGLDSLYQARVDTMFYCMQKRPDLMGVFLVNSRYFMLVFKNRVEIVDEVDNELKRLEAIGYESETINMIPSNWVAVGFERTFCPTYEALITPGRIYASPDWKTYYYKGKFHSNVHGPLKEAMFVEHYNELLKYKNKNGILLNASSEHILLE